MSQPLYHPRYYERAAVRHVACLSDGPVFSNVAWGLTGSLATRPQLDALLLRERQVLPIEVKAFCLDEVSLAEVLAKYRKLGFAQLMLIAPSISRTAVTVLARSRRPTVELLTFKPSQDELWAWYDLNWPSLVPGWVQTALATGRHHIRFILTRPTSSGRFVIGQQRSRIYDVVTLQHAFRRLPHAPARILWAPQRFSIPRDLIARKSRVTALGGFIGVDIDGDRLHRARHACQLNQDGYCQFCLHYALSEYQRLHVLLDGVPCVDVLASGGRGLHVYYVDEGKVRQRILTLANARQVRLDQNVTTSLTHLLALPGSLHAAVARSVTSLAATVRDATLEVAQCS